MNMLFCLVFKTSLLLCFFLLLTEGVLFVVFCFLCFVFFLILFSRPKSVKGDEMCILKTGMDLEGVLRVLGLKVCSLLFHFKWG